MVALLYVLIFNIEYVDHACIRAYKLQSFILPYDPTWLDSLWCLVCWNLVLICGELKGWKFDPTVVVLRQSLGWLGSDKAPSLSWWPYKKRGRKNYRTRQVHPNQGMSYTTLDLCQLEGHHQMWNSRTVSQNKPIFFLLNILCFYNSVC